MRMGRDKDEEEEEEKEGDCHVNRVVIMKRRE